MKSFDVTYRITLQAGESIKKKVEGICLEQSVELPADVLSSSIWQQIPGQLKQRRKVGDNRYDVVIEWPCDNIGGDITDFINLLFGNISLQNGIRITRLNWNQLPQDLLPGPSFGIEQIRRQLQIPYRPLSGTAVKPLGTGSRELSEKVYQMACGGIDIIKDDHGLTDQHYAPFEERVSYCVEAIRQAAMDTGHRALYFPNVTGDPKNILHRLELAHDLGADGALLCPHLTGLPVLSDLATSDIPLPLIAHPSFSGSLVRSGQHGMSPDFLYGQLWRALGADFVIFPNIGGRFSFSLEQCHSICGAARDTSLPYRLSFPMIGGGIDLENLSGWTETYGSHTVFLIGTSLYQHPDGLRYASRQFNKIVQENQ